MTVQLQAMQTLSTAISCSAAARDGSFTLLGTAEGHILQLPSTSAQHQPSGQRELTDTKSAAHDRPKNLPLSSEGESLQQQLSAADMAKEAAVNAAVLDGSQNSGLSSNRMQADTAASDTSTAQASSSQVTPLQDTVLLSLPQQHSSAVTLLALSSTGGYLASLSAQDGVIMLWQAQEDAKQSFTVLTSLTVGEAVCLAWTPDVPQPGPPGLLVGTRAGHLMV